jgi:hypothetical protein
MGDAPRMTPELSPLTLLATGFIAISGFAGVRQWRRAA